jgi:penicillin-binding protein 1A
MTVAVANRPVEQFETQVPMPDWQLTPEEEVYGDEAGDANDMAPMVDENGMPIGTPPPNPAYPQPNQPMVNPDGTPSQQELDQAFPPQQPQARRPMYPVPPPPRPSPYPPQPQPQQPKSTPPADPSQPRPNTA